VAHLTSAKRADRDKSYPAAPLDNQAKPAALVEHVDGCTRLGAQSHGSVDANAELTRVLTQDYRTFKSAQFQ
jgi:hypothetical protein